MPADSVVVRKLPPLTGLISVPGDKSISHRCAIIAALSEGRCRISNYTTGQDGQRTVSCLRQLGVRVDQVDSNTLLIHGRGLSGFKKPEKPLFAGNSGTTMRLLTGVLSGQPFQSTITGDPSLNKRDMYRVIEPLRRMGAQVEGTADGTPPLNVRGAELKPIRYRVPVASAQVKSCLMFAALFAKGSTIITEPIRTRDHTENLLPGVGLTEHARDHEIRVDGGTTIAPFDFEVPGDLSSAAFPIAAACLIPGSELTIANVTLNPTRITFLEVLKSMGAKISVTIDQNQRNEPSGTVTVRSSRLSGVQLGEESIPGLIDELPVLAVLASQTEHGLLIRGASELRKKESDRIEALHRNFLAMGVQTKVFDDGIEIPGNRSLRGATVDSFGDHRMAMAFAVAAQAADGITVVKDPGCVSVSYPGFWELFGTN